MKKKTTTSYPKWHANPVLIDFIREFEESHFRSESDTGANPGAMLLWNMVRHRAGLSLIEHRDLPCYDGKRQKYVLPMGSNLLGKPV